MSDDPAAFLHAFFDLWNDHALEEMVERLDPDLVVRDHRLLGSWGGGRDEWRTTMESWWSMVPDMRTEVEVLRVAEDRVAAFLRSRGTDSISGGEAGGQIYFVGAVAAGRWTTIDIFADGASALDAFGQASRAPGRAP